MFNCQTTTHLINDLVKQKNITVNKMLTDCQLNKDTMRHIKNGKIPSADRILIIADYLDCSIDYLLGRTDNPNVNR